MGARVNPQQRPGVQTIYKRYNLCMSAEVIEDDEYWVQQLLGRTATMSELELRIAASTVGAPYRYVRQIMNQYGIDPMPVQARRTTEGAEPATSSS